MTKRQRIEKLESEVVDLRELVNGLRLELANRQIYYYPTYPSYPTTPMEPFYRWDIGVSDKTVCGVVS